MLYEGFIIKCGTPKIKKSAVSLCSLHLIGVFLLSRYKLCKRWDMCKLLMIEDNKLDQLIMDKMIEYYDLFHHKESSLTASAAIEQIKKYQFDDDKLPDIIFLDLIMPGFNGFDFLYAFKKLYSYINKPIDVFVITASIDPFDLSKARSYDFVKDIIIKPVKSEVLANIYARYKPEFSAA